MRDIVQVSATIYNPFTGFVGGGSKIEPPEIPETDGFLDMSGYMFDDSELSIESELWS